MATFTVTIPDAQLTRVRDALCAYGGYTNGQVTNANARLALTQAIKNIVRQQEALAAAAAAEAGLTPPPDVT